MSNIVQIAPFLRDCNNCRFCTVTVCNAPKGWKWDKRYNRCATFRWSERALREQKEQLGKM